MSFLSLKRFAYVFILLNLLGSPTWALDADDLSSSTQQRPPAPAHPPASDGPWRRENPLLNLHKGLRLNPQLKTLRDNWDRWGEEGFDASACYAPEKVSFRRPYLRGFEFEEEDWREITCAPSLTDPYPLGTFNTRRWNGLLDVILRLSFGFSDLPDNLAAAGVCKAWNNCIESHTFLREQFRFWQTRIPRVSYNYGFSLLKWCETQIQHSGGSSPHRISHINFSLKQLLKEAWFVAHPKSAIKLVPNKDKWGNVILQLNPHSFLMQGCQNGIFSAHYSRAAALLGTRVQWDGCEMDEDRGQTVLQVLADLGIIPAQRYIFGKKSNDFVNLKCSQDQQLTKSDKLRKIESDPRPVLFPRDGRLNISLSPPVARSSSEDEKEDR